LRPAHEHHFPLDLLWFLVGREIKVRYRRSFFGLTWALLQPVPLALVLYGVFSGTFRGLVPNYAAYVLSGVIFWSFFQNGVLSSINSLHRSAAVLRQLPVQASVFPIAAVISSGVHLTLSLIGALVLLLALGLAPSLALLSLPVSVVMAIFFTAGVGLLLCPLALFFGDANEAISLILGVLVYATPVFYPVSVLPPFLQPIVLNTPLAAILACFREPILNGALPSASIMGIAVTSAALAFALGWTVFARYRFRIPFHV
jgi:ABC-2 type transport system permease protein